MRPVTAQNRMPSVLSTSLTSPLEVIFPSESEQIVYIYNDSKKDYDPLPTRCAPRSLEQYNIRVKMHRDEFGIEQEGK